MSKIHYTRFPVTSSSANLLATSRSLLMDFGTRHNRRNGIWPAPTCYTNADLSFMLRTCCGLATGKSPTFCGLATGKLVQWSSPLPIHLFRHFYCRIWLSFSYNAQRHRQTDGRHYDDNSRSYCAQYDRLKTIAIVSINGQLGDYWSLTMVLLTGFVLEISPRFLRGQNRIISSDRIRRSRMITGSDANYERTQGRYNEDRVVLAVL